MRSCMLVIVPALLACGGAQDESVDEPEAPTESLPAATDAAVSDPPATSEPSEPTASTEQPRVPELATEWWTDPKSCPKGAKLVGKPPPRGRRVTCTRRGAANGLEIMWLRNRVQVNTYKKGVYDGPYAVWRKGGGKIEEGLWKDGHQEGDFFQWHDDGTLKVEGKYRRDKRHGKWTYYDETGSVERVVKFKNGRAVKETAGGE